MQNPIVRFISFMRGDYASIKQISSDEQGILNLNRETFDQALAQHDFLLVKFYKSACPHCQKFDAEYTRLRELLQEQGSLVKLAQIDKRTDEVLAREHKVAAVPALRLFTHGNKSSIFYYGTKKAEPIFAWINKHCTNF